MKVPVVGWKSGEGCDLCLSLFSQSRINSTANFPYEFGKQKQPAADDTARLLLRPASPLHRFKVMHWTSRAGIFIQQFLLVLCQFVSNATLPVLWPILDTTVREKTQFIEPGKCSLHLTNSAN